MSKNEVLSGDLDTLLANTSALFSDINHLHDRLKNVADRVYGMNPTTAGAAETSAPEGMVTQIAWLTDHSFKALEKLAAQIDRLEKL